MSMNYQPPQRKETSPAKILAILALILLGIPLCIALICGVGLFALVNSGPAIVQISEDPQQAWQLVLNERSRREQVLVDDFERLIRETNNKIPESEVHRILGEKNRIDDDVKKLTERTIARHGEPPADVKQQLAAFGQLHEIATSLRFIRPFDPFPKQPSGGPSRLQEELARQRAEREARQQESAPASQPIPQPTPQPAPQELANNPPPVVNLPAERPVFTIPQTEVVPPQGANPPALNPPPVFDQPAPVNPGIPPANAGIPVAPANPQQPGNDTPGFPVTDLAQVKPRDIVFVQSGGQWVPALVQAKRGKLVQVRSESGEMAAVRLEQIRLQNEPAAKPDSNLPAALQLAEGTKKAAANKPEEEDDALFVAKPPGNQAQSQDTPGTTTTPPTGTKKPAAPVAEFRTWTSDTGEFKVEAELIGFEFDLVQLRRRDGKVHSLRIERLSAEDQKIVREKFK